MVNQIMQKCTDVWKQRNPGKHLKEHDIWKEKFLKEINEKYKDEILEFVTKRKTQKYRIIGVPFYNNTDENQFKQSLYEVLEN